MVAWRVPSSSASLTWVRPRWRRRARTRSAFQATRRLAIQPGYTLSYSASRRARLQRPGAEDFQKDALPFDIPQDGGHVRVGGVSVDLHEEQIVPGAPLRGPGVDAAEVEVGLGEDLDDVAQRADPVLDAEADRRLVAPTRPLAGLGPDDEEAGVVAAQVLDVLGQDL